MAKTSPKKRPCCICRKWFQPNVRQKDRQKTCGSPDCKTELHRRNCDKWNNRNKEYFSNNYLSKKIEQAEEKAPEEVKRPPPEPAPAKAKKVTLSTSPLVLPCEVIVNEYGVRSLMIIHYLTRQIIFQARGRNTGIP